MNYENNIRTIAYNLYLENPHNSANYNWYKAIEIYNNINNNNNIDINININQPKLYSIKINIFKSNDIYEETHIVSANNIEEAKHIFKSSDILCQKYTYTGDIYNIITPTIKKNYESFVDSTINQLDINKSGFITNLL